MSTILVVDDMAIFRDPLAASLRLAGYETTCAVSGKEAVAAKRPNLILLDLAMPVQDGLGFLKALQSQGRDAAPPPAIVLSAASERPLIAAVDCIQCMMTNLPGRSRSTRRSRSARRIQSVNTALVSLAP